MTAPSSDQHDLNQSVPTGASPPQPLLTPAVAGASLLLFVVVGWFTIPYLPPGICYDDFGDLQLASTTLRFAHPPGYAGYVTLGHLLTRIPGVDAAYVVTLACFTTGLAVLGAVLLWQLRLGVGLWLAIAVCLGFSAHPRFWINIRAPEVYMPTLALMVWAAWLLLRFYDSGQVWRLYLAALGLGFAVANRPPVILIVPFFLVVWMLASRRWHGRIQLGELGWVFGIALLPSAYSVAYTLVRDRPGACYNYIELYNEENPVLPSIEDGLSARWRRAAWLLSAEQFDEYKGVTWEQFAEKLSWLGTQITYERPFTDLLALIFVAINTDPPDSQWYARLDTWVFCALTAFGLVLACRRCRLSGILLCGFAFPFLVFVLMYHVYGQSADLLPVLFAQAVLLGVLGAQIFPQGAHWVRQVVAIGLVIGGVFLFRAQAGSENYEIAAHDYVEEMDMASFPGQAVICGNWRYTVPIRYAACVLTPRSDIHVVTSGPGLCIDYASRKDGRPVYIPRAIESDGRCTITPFRNLYRLECQPKMTDHDAVSSFSN